METASRFSALSRKGDADGVVSTIRAAFEWIDWLGVEVVGGAPSLHASVRGGKLKIPVTALSGAVARVIAILVAISQRKRGLVLVDEVENGIYHGRQSAVANAILSAARKNECQMFITTHSIEWLRGLIEVAGDDVADITLWRLEDNPPAGNNAISLFRFNGETLKAGIEYGAEVRGDGPPRKKSKKDRNTKGDE